MLLRTLLLLALFIAVSVTARAQTYDVLPHRPSAFGQLWASDGISSIASENTSVGNRFRLGANIRFGNDAKYSVGWTILDILTSGEHAASVGDLSRGGSGPTLAYYFIPDRLWIDYALDIASATGSRVSGSVGTYGHQLGVGYRFYGEQMLGLGVELSYLYLPNVTVPVLDLNTNAAASANYPSAQVWTLSLVVSFDLD